MKEKRLTREQARELYDDLHKAMSQMMGKDGKAIPQAAPPAGQSAEAQSKIAKEIAQAIKSGLNGSPPPKVSGPLPPVGKRASGAMAAPLRARGASHLKGQSTALMIVALFCCAKIAVSALEMSGAVDVQKAEAVTMPPPRPAGPQWSKEEVKILSSLDHRRAELEERNARLDQRDQELASRDHDVAVRLTDLKELTERLKLERDKGEKQRNTQLDQLANVYGSMNPPEAAQLLQQLDIQVALSLVQRMPEKRIGQILALMTPDRALDLTNLLSRRESK